MYIYIYIQRIYKYIYICTYTFQFRCKNKRGKNVFAINRHTFPSRKQIKSSTVRHLNWATPALKIYHKLENKMRMLHR